MGKACTDTGPRLRPTLLRELELSVGALAGVATIRAGIHWCSVATAPRCRRMSATSTAFSSIRETVLATFRQLASDSARRSSATGYPVAADFEDAVVAEVPDVLPTPEVLAWSGAGRVDGYGKTPGPFTKLSTTTRCSMMRLSTRAATERPGQLPALLAQKAGQLSAVGKLHIRGGGRALARTCSAGNTPASFASTEITPGGDNCLTVPQ